VVFNLAAAMDELRIDPSEGVYDAVRAAALSGVPLTTLHYWARHGIYRPSVAAGPHTRFWSWGDLLALRAIAWFRARESPGQPRRTSMRQVREMLKALEAGGIPRDQLYRVVAMTEAGQLVIRLDDAGTITADDCRQGLMDGFLPLVQPFGTGPDLYRPRPLLRIIPGKLHGEPHLVGTRIASAVVFEFARMGYPLSDIQDFYPDADPAALQQAIEFEQSLRAA
jgi:uncharacterized protein (DUF433 family)/DNA-binding transcriptional MerR regulator